MSENYQSFQSFTAKCENAKRTTVTSLGILVGKRRFWKPEMAQHVGQRVKYWIDPTGPDGDSAVVLNLDGEYISNVREVGKPLKLSTPQVGRCQVYMTDKKRDPWKCRVVIVVAVFSHKGRKYYNIVLTDDDKPLVKKWANDIRVCTYKELW